MIKDTQLPERYRSVIEGEITTYESGRKIEKRDSIPDTPDIPIEDPKLWLRIPDVICVFVDMQNSTKLSAESHDKSTAGAYQLFSSTAVKLFSEFESPYIDLRGDGIFALFDGTQPYRAIASAITFKTFASLEFVSRIKEATDIDVGCHIGVDIKTVLVRKIGFKRYRGRTDRQNEVWAGRPVNMASKLSSLASDKEVIVSDRFFQKIQNDLVLKSCGCTRGKEGSTTGQKTDLWEKLDVSTYSYFDFKDAYKLKSEWCLYHGKQYCEDILALDK